MERVRSVQTELDKGQRSIKGLNSGSEGVVILDLVMTVQKPNIGEELSTAGFDSVEAGALVQRVIQDHPTLEEQSASHLYAKIARTAIKEGSILDNLHLGDVLVALRNAGFSINQSTGLISCEKMKGG